MIIPVSYPSRPVKSLTLSILAKEAPERKSSTPSAEIVLVAWTSTPWTATVLTATIDVAVDATCKK